MGKKKDINQKFFEHALRCQATKEMICGAFDLDSKTLTRWCKDTYGMGFSQVSNMFKEEGKLALLGKQFKLAGSNAHMGVFLGKNYLGQTDKVVLESVGDSINIAMAEFAGIMKQADQVDGE